MKILVLTSMNPVISGDAYSKIANYFDKRECSGKAKIDFLCFPFFAEISREIHGREYLPGLFSMMKWATKPEMQKKLYRRNNTVVVGNSYKNQKFDIIVSFDDIGSEPFDPYITAIEEDENFKDFLELVDIGNIYRLKDAEYHFHNIDHLILFIKEAFYGKNKSK